MIARFGHHLDVRLCCADEAGRRKKLIGGDELVLGPRQQEHWDAELGEIDPTSQGHKS